jgi:hypothetical protein
MHYGANGINEADSASTLQSDKPASPRRSIRLKSALSEFSPETATANESSRFA